MDLKKKSKKSRPNCFLCTHIKTKCVLCGIDTMKAYLWIQLKFVTWNNLLQLTMILCDMVADRMQKFIFWVKQLPDTRLFVNSNGVYTALDTDRKHTIWYSAVGRVCENIKAGMFSNGTNRPQIKGKRSISVFLLGWILRIHLWWRV